MYVQSSTGESVQPDSQPASRNKTGTDADSLSPLISQLQFGILKENFLKQRENQAVVF